MKSRLTTTGAPAADLFVPAPEAVPAVIDAAGGALFLPVSATPQGDGPKQVKSEELLKEGTDTLLGEMFKPGLSPQFIRALSIVIQFVLIKLRTPPTIPDVAHSANADTLLLPAIEALLGGAGIIEEEEPRAFKGIDLQQVAARKTLLEQFREILEVLLMAGECVEAGSAHIEQYLDTVARAVYPHIVSLVAEDRNAARLLEPTVALVAAPAELGQKTRRSNARLVAQTMIAQAQGAPAPVAAPVPAPGTPAPSVPAAAPVPATPVVPGNRDLAGGAYRPGPQPPARSKRRK